MIKKIIEAYRASFSGLSRETWILSLVMLVNRSSSMAVPFMSLYMTQFLHRSASDAGLIITLFGAGAVLGGLAGGKMTDLVGFRSVQIVSSLISGAFFIFFSTLTHFPALCVFTVVISFFAEAFRPANFAAIATYALPGTQTRSYSLNRLATNLGWAAGSSAGGIVASFSYPLLFRIDGLVSVLAGLAILAFLPSRKAGLQPAQENIPAESSRKPWKDVVFVKFILLTTMLTTAFFLMFRVVPLFYKTVWHIDELHIGLILGLNGLIIALFEMVMINKLENRRSPVYYIIKGVLFILTAFLMLMLPGISVITVAILSIILMTIGEMYALPFINTFVMSRTTPANRGQYAAGYNLSWSAAQIAGPSAGFYLAERFGYNWLWTGLMLLMLLCAAGFRMLEKQMN